MGSALIMLGSGVQGGRLVPHETLLIVGVVVALALVLLVIVLVTWRRRRRVEPVEDQWQATAVMGELCPHGWTAQITLYGWGAPVPPDAPASRVPLVELEWKLYDEQPGRVVVARRVWAPTIAQALQSMVEDRRTDLALEEIERAVGDDAWSAEEDAWSSE
ncbi:MAG: hypothetical protein ACYCSI_11765 [Solirubrobacteraceae bacterium]